tara:strand:- start:211 stop:618 length:408 start_codon:yes stop_codon:yes gene_type:complete
MPSITVSTPFCLSTQFEDEDDNVHVFEMSYPGSVNYYKMEKGAASRTLVGQVVKNSARFESSTNTVSFHAPSGNVHYVTMPLEQFTGQKQMLHTFVISLMLFAQDLGFDHSAVVTAMGGTMQQLRLRLGDTNRDN